MLSLLVNTGFQVLFHSPPGVLFTFPSRYYALSVAYLYLALGGGPPCFPPDFSCPVVLWYQLAFFRFHLLDFHILWLSFPTHSISFRLLIADPQPQIVNYLVWALSISLAATLKIDLSFSSSGYLDVSLPRVPSYKSMYSTCGNGSSLPLSSLIRISAALCVFAAPRSFSQLVTSFVGFRRQGIRPVLFVA